MNRELEFNKIEFHFLFDHDEENIRDKLETNIEQEESKSEPEVNKSH